MKKKDLNILIEELRVIHDDFRLIPAKEIW